MYMKYIMKFCVLYCKSRINNFISDSPIICEPYYITVLGYSKDYCGFHRQITGLFVIPATTRLNNNEMDLYFCW